MTRTVNQAHREAASHLTGLGWEASTFSTNTLGLGAYCEQAATPFRFHVDRCVSDERVWGSFANPIWVYSAVLTSTTGKPVFVTTREQRALEERFLFRAGGQYIENQTNIIVVPGGQTYCLHGHGRWVTHKHEDGCKDHNHRRGR